VSLLEVRDLSVRYGPLEALRNVSFDVDEGEIVFLVGPNGAGKSTLLRSIANVVPASAGSIRLGGQATAGLAPERVVGLEFTLVPEGREIFGTLTVEENLKLGAYRRRDQADIRRDMEQILEELPALKPRLPEPAALLSGGQQQMLAIGRALMARPRLIALDEPSLGLAPMIIDQIYEILLRLRARRNLSLLIAEQSFSRANRLDARVLLLRNSVCVLQGKARALHADGSLEKAYFGF